MSVIPGRPPVHTHALFPLLGRMKDRCLCAGSSWQLVAGLLMSLGGSSDGIQSGFITEQEGPAAAARSPYCTFGGRYCTCPL